MNEKPYYEKEISLQELFLVYLEKWRSILITVIIGALLLCVYRYCDMVSDSKNAEIQVDTIREAIESNEEQVQLLEAFKEESTILGLNAYGVWKRVDTYCMDATEEQAALLESFVVDGALYQKISEETGYLIPDLEQIVLFNNRFPDDEQIIESQPGNVFRVTILESDEKKADELAEAVSTAIEGYLQQFSVQLDRVHLASNLTFVPSILDIQKDFDSDYEKISKELIQARAELQESTEKIEGVENTGNLIKELIKFGIVGGALGFILVSLFWLLKILTSNRVLFLAHFEETFQVKLLGILTKEEKKNVLDRWIEKKRRKGLGHLTNEELYELTMANLLKRLHKEKNVKKIFLAGTLAEEAVSDFGRLKNELLEMGYEISEYQQVYCTPATWRTLEKYEAILFAEKKDVSNAKDVLQEIEIAKELELEILGVVMC